MATDTAPPANHGDRRPELPESYDIHWSEARKEEVVRAVHDKLLTFDEARWRYLLSRQEFREWERRVVNKDTQRNEKKARQFENN
ncbi:MAG: DUF1153 domain-containing protein [Sphingomonadales bacterium]|nr:DUF1153 domain-containing protein [Sphingomonadales bacterium]MBD3772568.1 DUF1153 domain-containing protein [Paracoccaceae bacterium]